MRPAVLLLIACALAGVAAAGPTRRTTHLAGDQVAAWSRRTAWESFAARGGGAWSVLVDARTGRPAIAWGRGIALASTGPGATLSEVEATVRREVLERHRDLLGVDPAILRLDDAGSGSALGGRLWSLDFVPAPGGIPVEGARVGVRLRDGRLVELGTVLLGDAVPPSPPTWSADAALRVAARAAGVASPQAVASDLVALACVDDAACVPGATAWRVRFRDAGALPTWEARVDARSGALLSLADANATACETSFPRRGVVMGGVLPESPGDAEVVRAFRRARLDTSAGPATADASGAFDDDGRGATSRLDGLHASTRCASCTSPAAARAAADDSGVVDFGLGGADATGNGVSTRAERSAWYHVSRARDLAASFLDPATTPWLDETVVAEVNLDATCTALWNGARLQLSRAGGACANAGEVAGLVAHEWGHGLVDATGAGADRAHGEAMADLLAMLLWRRPEIGAGWLASGPVRCLDWRTCDDAPGPLGVPLTAAAVAAECPPGDGTPGGGEMHCEGQVLGQAGWDLVQELRAVHPEWSAWNAAEELVLASMLSSDTYLPDDIGGAYWAFVLADDDDADLSNGTPHGGAIWRAFDLHGIAPASCGSHAGCLLPAADSPACAPPAAPAVVAAATASPRDGMARVELSWPADPAAASWNVWRSDFADHDAFVLAASGLTSPAWTDEILLNGTTAWHAVQAVSPGGCVSRDVVPVRTDVDLPRLRLVSATVSDAAFGDGDGVPEPGERLEILPRVAHAGGAGARTNVTAELASPDAAVAVAARAAVAFPDVLPASEADALEPFLLDLAPGSAACGTRLPLTILLASNGYCWREGLELDVGAGGGDVAVTGVVVFDAATNANGRAEPGEAASLLFSVQALGPGGLTGASVTAQSDDALVAVSGTSALNDVAAGGTAFMATPLALVVDAAHACPSEARLRVVVTAAEGCWTRELVLPIGRTLVAFDDAFERDGAWTWGDAADDADRGAFVRGLPNAVDDGRPWQPGPGTGGRCALTGNETAPGDPEAGDLDGTTTMTSRIVDLTGEADATLSWRAWLATSAPGGDRLRLLVSRDGGAWTEAWRQEADAPAWTQHAVTLAGLLGSPLGATRVRFEATGDPAHVVEAAIDDVRIALGDCEPPAPRPDVALDSVLLDDGSGLGHGNGDGIPDPGESLVLVPTLVGTGVTDAVSVGVGLRLVSGPPEALLVGASATAPDLAPRDFVTTNDPHLRVRLAPSIACGATIELELTATFQDLGGATYVRRLGTIALTVGRWSPASCDPFVDPSCLLPIERIGALAGFEGPGDAGWSHGIDRGAGVTSPSARDDWQRAAPLGLGSDPGSAWEGSRAFGTDLGVDGSDGLHDASTRTFLESPAWDASRFSHVRLRYARWLSAQDGAHDQARVTVSGTVAWSNAAAGPLADAGCADVEGLASTYASDAEDMPEGPAGWKLVEHDVSATADHDAAVVVRFELQSDGRCERGGWTIDAVELVGVRDEVRCRPHAPCDASFLQIDGGPDARLGCGGTATLQARVLVADGPWGQDVAWSPAAGIADPAALVTTTTQPGVYEVTITDRTTGCARRDTVLVTDFRVPPTVVPGNDGPLTCTRTSASLFAVASGGDGSLGYAYEWSPAAGLADPFAATTPATIPGTYSVTVTDLATGCTATDSTSLARDASPPIVDAGPDAVSSCFGIVTLQGAVSGGNGSLGFVASWAPPADLDDPSSCTPSTNVPGTYTLTVTDLANGCTGSDDVLVTEPGDRDPPVPVADTLRLARAGADVVLDLSLHAGADAYRAYRSVRASDLPRTGLDGTSAFLRLDRVAGPLLTDAGAAATGEPRLLFYRVQAVNSCGVEE